MAPTFGPLLDVGIAASTLAGQQESGDQHLVKAFPGGILIGVVDGLGHGTEAAHAARTAIGILEQHTTESLELLARRCHRALTGTRGAAMSLVSVRCPDDILPEGRMTWLGIGNVEGVVLRADAAVMPRHQGLLLRGGIVGNDLPRIRPATLLLTGGDLLIFATDGVRSGFLEGLKEDGPPQQLAEGILARHGRGTDDALVLVARYLGAP